MKSFRIATIAGSNGTCAALVTGERVIPVAEATGRTDDSTVAGLLADWDRALPRLDAIISEHRNSLALADIKLLAPLPMPGTIYCAGANYLDHAVEMAATLNMAPPPDPHTIGERPWHFIKSSRCVAPTQAHVHLPKTSSFVDWEAELAVVIGRRAKDISAREALSYVVGYTIANDLSARDLALLWQVFSGGRVFGIPMRGFA